MFDGKVAVKLEGCPLGDDLGVDGGAAAGYSIVISGGNVDGKIEGFPI